MALEGRKQQVVITTKVGNSLAAPEQNFTEPHIRGAVDASLTRLEVDHIDLYQLHGPRSTP
jgi:aryl-alcohol dehydrogenase-like predicted oxidoreductase